MSIRSVHKHVALLARWGIVFGAAALVGTVAELFGLPGSHFFGGVVVGLCVAIFNLGKKGNMPPIVFEGALSVTGAVLGTYLTASAVGDIASNILPICLISIGTLLVSIAMGLVLTRVTDISLPTALLGMLAGGSAMNIVTSDRMQADVRIVTFMHLVRLLLVLAATPILIHFYLAPKAHLGLLAASAPEIASPFLLSFAFTVCVAIAGLWLAKRFPYSGSMLLTPLFLAALLIALPPFRGVIPPEGFREFAALIIGLQVGLRFNSEVLRRARKYFLTVCALMLVVLGVCGFFAWILTATTTMSPLTAYLATTPGGRTAVVALAFTSGADPAMVLAIQTLRLLIMTILAPIVMGYLVRGRLKAAPVIADEEFLE